METITGYLKTASSRRYPRKINRPSKLANMIPYEIYTTAKMDTGGTDGRLFGVVWLNKSSLSGFPSAPLTNAVYIPNATTISINYVSVSGRGY